MTRIRPAAERGATRLKWLDSKHTFSFNRYYDPAHMGFRSLRVINDDWVAPGGMFGKHPHEDMEILTWVLSGAIVHEDSTGARGEIRPGDAQKMSAGTGIVHSEANASQTDPLHFLQIWILPDEQGLAPEYQLVHIPEEERKNRLRLVASPDSGPLAIPINQDVSIFNALLDPGAAVQHELHPDRHAWLQVAQGSVTLNGYELQAGDGVALSEESVLSVQATQPSEILVFDLA